MSWQKKWKSMTWRGANMKKSFDSSLCQLWGPREDDLRFLSTSRQHKVQHCTSNQSSVCNIVCSSNMVHIWTMLQVWDDYLVPSWGRKTRHHVFPIRVFNHSTDWSGNLWASQFEVGWYQLLVICRRIAAGKRGKSVRKEKKNTFVTCDEL